jgi:hypothetical protein
VVLAATATPLPQKRPNPVTGSVLLVGAIGRVVIAAAKPRRAATYASMTFAIPAGRTKTLKLKSTARSRLHGHKQAKKR